MAKDDDPWKRFRDREDEQDKEVTKTLSLFERRTQITHPELNVPAAPSTDKLDQLLHDAQMLIEQVSNLLKMYVVGVESLPPVEKRKILERTMEAIQSSNKPTQASQFRAKSLQASYASNKDRWDRIMRDLETGKIKRLNPKR
jgi:hypothetical protein